jgi:hypothetical protein
LDKGSRREDAAKKLEDATKDAEEMARVAAAN